MFAKGEANKNKLKGSLERSKIIIIKATQK